MAFANDTKRAGIAKQDEFQGKCKILHLGKKERASGEENGSMRSQANNCSGIKSIPFETSPKERT